MCEWVYNIREATSDFLRSLLGVKVLTNLGP
jgi:hypothetical protein